MKRTSWWMVAFPVSLSLALGAAVEPMAVPAVGARSATECGVAIGPAMVWDFTNGTLPSGGRLGACAFATERGLGCRDFANVASQGGFQLDHVYTPDGAFLFEADLEVGNHAVSNKTNHVGRVWDDMGISHGAKKTNSGFEIDLQQEPNGYWTPKASFGLGKKTYEVAGQRVRLYPGARMRYAVFFGANGRVVIEFAGLVTEKVLPEAGSLAPATWYRATIGSRPVGHYANFDGFVRKVMITPMRSESMTLQAVGRVAFLRGEENAQLKVQLDNRSRIVLNDVSVVYEQFCEGGRVAVSTNRIGSLAAQDSAAIPIVLETRVRPGWHVVRAEVKGRDENGASRSYGRLIRYGIGPRAGERLRTVMWGLPVAMEPDALTDLGFTHGYFYAGGPEEVKSDFDPTSVIDLFDRSLVGGLGAMRIIGPSYYPACADTNRYVRYDCLHRPCKAHDRPEVSNPELVERFRSICAVDAEMFAGHPAFQGILPYSERRDRSIPSFNVEARIYKEQTGRDIPQGVDGRTYRKDFAAQRFSDGIVPDDDEIFQYYKWFLGGGDGWPAFLSAGMAEFQKRIKGRDFVAFWDPAARWAPIAGAGGTLDMLNQWCYAVPEPMNVAGICEEMLALTSARPGQQTSIMTQLICYRSKMAPKEEVVPNMPAWATKFAKTKFPTIPPDVLSEATWSMIAKPVQTIMYHGWATIHDNHVNDYYGYTNPKTTVRVRELLKGVVAPLGPTLLKLGRPTSGVALLESFATCAMGGPASWGWSAPSITFLQRARLDPRVIYDDMVRAGALGDVKVLYAPQMQYANPSVIERIRQFQAKGGLLVADGEMLKSLQPDVVVPIVSFEAPPESDHAEDVDAQEAAKSAELKTHRATRRAKQAMVDAAQAVRKALSDKGFVPPVDSSSPDIVVYARNWKSTPYVFAINDNRAFGDYVGPWGRVMENGVPMSGWIALRNAKGKVGAVYELSRGKRVDFTQKGNKVGVPVKFDTCDGRLFVFLPEAIASVDVKAPDRVVCGERISVEMTVLDAHGKTVPAALPVEIRLFSADGREVDGVGYACAEGGVARVSFLTNCDDPAGAYRLVCRDRASGIEVERTLDCRR